MKKKIDILYEDKDMVIINKPSGLIVHADGKTEEPSVVDWVLENYPKTKNVGEPLILTDGTKVDRPGIVHRIDRDTSGILVIAKNKDSFEFLKKQFQDRLVHKTYHTFVYGDVKDDRGTIDRPIGKSPADFRRWSAQRGARGEMREAITYFRVLARKDGISFVEASPKTGRTHQIRVHFKAINHPVVSDFLYASDNFLTKENPTGLKRLALHAKGIEITSPSGKLLEITAPYPTDFKKAVSWVSK
jgi:23S rRNA pseudouridine1911/1915/1917 synthase